MDCVRGLCGLVCHDLCIKSYCDVYEVGIGREIRFTKRTDKLGLIGTVTEGFTVSETVITK